MSVPHNVGPYYIYAEGPDTGVYIRLWFTDRRADPQMVHELRLLARNTVFDEQPCLECSSEAVDFRVWSRNYQWSNDFNPADSAGLKAGARGGLFVLSF